MTDPRVISQYLRVKQDQSSKKKKRRQLQVVTKPVVRKKPKAVSEAIKPSKPPKELPNVRCGACGALGHMRTNRICPLFNIPEAHYVPSPAESHPIDPNAPVKVEGGKLTISIDSLKRVAEDRARSLTFKLPSKVLSNASSGTSTPLSSSESSSVTTTKKRPSVVKKRKLAPWQRITEDFPQLREDLTSFNEKLAAICTDLKSETDSWPFHRPVNKRQYPLYYRLISKPVDLQTIAMGANRKRYVSTDEFLERLRLMVSNCRQYNGADHPFTHTAERLVKIAEEKCAALKDLEDKFGEALGKDTLQQSQSKSIPDEEKEEEGGDTEVQDEDTIESADDNYDTANEGATDVVERERDFDEQPT